MHESPHSVSMTCTENDGKTHPRRSLGLSKIKVYHEYIHLQVYIVWKIVKFSKQSWKDCQSI